MPKLVEKSMAACDAIVLDRNRFPELGNGRGQRRFLFTQRNRERRSQRLEAIALVAKDVFFHMDVLSRRSGKTRSDGRKSCDAVDVDQIAKETDLYHRRVERARADLISAGYFDWHQPIKEYDVTDADGNPTGEKAWRAFAAVLTVQMLFFERLGIHRKDVLQMQQEVYDYRTIGPDPILDIRLQRERRRQERAMNHAEKLADLGRHNASRIVTASAARVAKLYGRKDE
jgi:hypothetical protein